MANFADLLRVRKGLSCEIVLYSTLSMCTASQQQSYDNRMGWLAAQEGEGQMGISLRGQLSAVGRTSEDSYILSCVEQLGLVNVIKMSWPLK